jgi:hypothetical protein
LRIADFLAENSEDGWLFFTAETRRKRESFAEGWGGDFTAEGAEGTALTDSEPGEGGVYFTAKDAKLNAKGETGAAEGKGKVGHRWGIFNHGEH